MRHKSCLLTFVLLWLAPPLSAASLLTTAFTYQGRLGLDTNAATGTYDFQFHLRDALADGNSVSITNTVTLPVANGLFAVALDFGPSPFSNSNRWLEIAIRTNGTQAFVTLSPRQQLTPTPFANFAANAGSALTLSDAFSGNLAGGTNLSGASLQSGTVNSNAFDAPTWFATTNRPGTVSTNLTLYNPVFGVTTTTNRIVITNGLYYTDGLSNTVSELFQIARGAFGEVHFYTDPHHYFDERYWSIHGGVMGGDTPEMVYTIPGSIAYFYEWIQHGAPNPGASGLGAPYEYWNATADPYVIGGVTNWNLHDSQALWLFPVGFSPDNGSNWLTAGSFNVLGAPAFMAPAIHFRATSTNGSAAWSFYDKFDATPISLLTSGEHRNYDTAIERLRITVGPDADQVAALTVHGAVQATRFIGDGSRLTNVGPIYGWADLASGTVAISNTNVSRSSVIMLSYLSRDGSLAQIGEDLRYRTNGSFRVISSNPLDTNSVAWSVSGGTLPVAVDYDPDALGFFARATNLTALQKQALNNFIMAAKTDGWWANETAIYPFVGGTPDLHALNLLGDQHPMTWHGYLATSAAHDANGVTSTGSGDYGDLGFSPANAAPYTTNGAHLFAYLGSFNGNTNWGSSSPGDYYVMGGYNQNDSPYLKNCVRFQYNPLTGRWSIGAAGLNTSEWQTSNSPIDSGAASLNSSDLRGPYAVARYDSTHQYAYLRAFTSPVYSEAASGLAANHFTVFAATEADDNSVGDTPPFTINLRGFMVGGPMDSALWAKVAAAWDQFEAALDRKVP